MLEFHKMHSLGNDFVIFDAINQPVHLSLDTIIHLANRQTGVGFDQMLIITSSNLADIGCVIFNSDGSQAKQCGNGLRCVARLAYDLKLTTAKTLTIEISHAIYQAHLLDQDLITLNMGFPKPIQVSSNAHAELQKAIDNRLPHARLLGITSLGNPHLIVQVSDINTSSLEIADTLRTNRLFEDGINVGFIEINSPSSINLRTFERGAGLTLACGSNACAAVISGIEHQLLDTSVDVFLPLGQLNVTWENKKAPAWLKGPVSYCFKGQLPHLA